MLLIEEAIVKLSTEKSLIKFILSLFKQKYCFRFGCVQLQTILGAPWVSQKLRTDLCLDFP